MTTLVGGPLAGNYELDERIAVRYPHAQAFLALAMNPEIGIARAHRDAGLARAAVIRCDDGGAPLVRDR